MSKNKQIWISPNGNNSWRIHKPGDKRDIKRVSEQQQAFKIARKIAQNQELELVMQGKNGKIREKNSYGNDSYPPKG